VFGLFCPDDGFAARAHRRLKDDGINAMEHGNKGRSDARVTVSLDCRDNVINVAVMDEGDGIKKFPPKPDIEKIIEDLESPIGFGLFLISQLADQVEFNEVTDIGHVVKMAIKMDS
jgi:anti-sigma regulatory factor (Ser/Thr protein kinase)